MRVIKKSEVREIIIGHVELTLIFLLDDFLCKIAILESTRKSNPFHGFCWG